MTEPTLLFRLREAARVEMDELVKFNLKLVADELDGALVALAKDVTESNLRIVNGHWAHGMRMLDFADRRPKGGGRGGALKEGARLAA